MANTELFDNMDRGLRELRERLFLVRGLMKRSKLDERMIEVISDLYERAGFHERALRPRVGLPQVPHKNVRSETVTVLEKKGVAVAETPQLIIEELQACQEHARALEGYFRFFNQHKVAEFYRRLRYEAMELARIVSLKTGVTALAEPETPAASAATTVEVASSAQHSRVADALRFAPLYFILDESICSFRDPLRVAYDAISAGIRIMQLRFKNMGSRELLSLARKIGPICSERNCLLIINDRPDIAMIAGAAGVHLGTEDMDVGDVKQLQRDLLVGGTARTVADALALQAAGADYIGAGSVYPSATKPGMPLIGIPGIKAISNSLNIPVVGIGGITMENSSTVLKAGASGVSSVSPFRTRRSVRNLCTAFITACRDAQRELVK